MTRKPYMGKAYWAVQIGVSAFFAVAARARDGKLSVAELHALQALGPDNLYPGSAPSSTRIPSA